MEDFGDLMSWLVQIMSVPFTIWGFTMNFWDILIYSLIAFIILVVIVRFIYER